MARIALVTCKRWPRLSASDTELQKALELRGHSILAAPWNGPLRPFLTCDLVVVRAAWDYHEDAPGYRSWLGHLQVHGVVVVNDPALIIWNLDKRQYLNDLAKSGVRIIPCISVQPTTASVTATLRRQQWERAVLKPAVGASGAGVRIVDVATPELAVQDLTEFADRDFLLQEYVSEVSETGEVSGVFFSGAYSHAIRRRPRPGEFRVNSRYGGTVEACSLHPSVVLDMAAAVTALPKPATYVRVDGIERESGFTVMEVEVNEPALGLHLNADAASRFAAALEENLHRAA